MSLSCPRPQAATATRESDGPQIPSWDACRPLICRDSETEAPVSQELWKGPPRVSEPPHKAGAGAGPPDPKGGSLTGHRAAPPTRQGDPSAATKGQAWGAGGCRGDFLCISSPSSCRFSCPAPPGLTLVDKSHVRPQLESGCTDTPTAPSPFLCIHVPFPNQSPGQAALGLRQKWGSEGDRHGPRRCISLCPCEAHGAPDRLTVSQRLPGYRGPRVGLNPQPPGRRSRVVRPDGVSFQAPSWIWIKASVSLQSLRALGLFLGSGEKYTHLCSHTQEPGDWQTPRHSPQ